MENKEIENLRRENDELKKELAKLKSIKANQKNGMVIKASRGSPVTRAPWGYKFENKKLVPGEHSQQVEELFQDFLNQKISLTKLAKKYDFSVNGLKKILTNFTYVGKVRFAGEMHQGSHQQLISSTLFNHVQNKLEGLGIGKKNNYKANPQS
ncbi:recombinase family protein [Candidatus Pacearchaeota archaeon]|nr:recombinase family protein [Candidatus Pacearchaeota archaeon]